MSVRWMGWSFVLVLAGCASDLPGEGMACTSANRCAEGLDCVADASDAPRCMRRCAAGTGVCDDGLACLELTTGSGGVCWLGGTTALGAACSGGRQCAPGGVCVRPAAGADSVCAQACSPPATTYCEAGERCAELASGGGYCAP
ncbi:MAG: hypothetical protein KF729_17835 [Sandaracinaceae bacterium]|nr:hypothetical protein [Sandaracinaceae bacterium]